MKIKVPNPTTWKEIDIILAPNKYCDETNFWMLASIIGQTTVANFVRDHDYAITSYGIFKLLKESHKTFIFDRRRKIIYSTPYHFPLRGFKAYIKHILGIYVEIPLIDAVERFGLDKVEESVEKLYTYVGDIK